ncbi:Histidine kinase [Oceanospirillum multiglobuliferum]|uniref:Signal transduction histidine kinase internal region domain-containing protein n=1 Tax=Oceanospirillum multiglobuliferum TaxID=64969 RepID=A0A1T4N2W0_9GAMM|nr:histidine kinase [Oceanospirillum multiglobuliferum]OPX55821.1 hypothetical protein BTE48_06365 [Oceanospirillum multiglobuliferum]SJZ73710.1 Histidine kinase [Oceanospirillum multiglobuliferum]
MLPSLKRRLRQLPWDSLLRFVILINAIALLTWILWEGAYLMHLAISMGYGLSTNLTNLLLQRIKPNWHNVQITLLSILVGLSLGTLNANWLISLYYPVSHVLMLQIIAIALAACVSLYYYFYSREQALALKQQLQDSLLQQSEQEKALAQSQLLLLQSQIEPHFLFNSLANLKALIREEPKQAEQLLDQLTALLRASMHNNRQQQVPLQDEFAYLEAYLAIQQTRLAGRLSFSVEAQPDSLSCQIPPFLLQPLVENAVLHGIEPKAEGGQINLLAQLDQSNPNQPLLRISLIDTGVGFNFQAEYQHHQGQGLALQNIRARLKALYGDKARLSLQERAQTAGVQVLLELPCGH